MSRTTRWILLLLAAALVPFCLEALHFVLGRPDRIGAAARCDALLDVRDQVLRYQYERGVLPPSLDALIPRYLQPEQVRQEGELLYVYAPEERLLKEAEGSLVRGLVDRRLPPFSAELLPPERSARTLSSASAPSEPPEPEPGPSEPAEAKVPASVPPKESPARPEPAPPLPAAPPKPTGPVDAFKAGVVLVPEGPALPDPPRDALVFEGEHYSDTNYGWEVHPDKDSSGGAYLHTKEGIANGPGQTKQNVGDFYNLHDNTEKTYLIYQLDIPKSGTYYGYARMWTTDTHCSNSICAAFDKGGPYTTGMGNRTPFRWVWSPTANNPVRLSKGEHYLHLFIHEDGVRIDQFILSPVRVSGGQAYKANLIPGKDTAWSKKEGPPVHLTLDLKSMVVTEKSPPECNLVVRRLRPSEGTAMVRAVLHEATGGEDLTVAEYTLKLKALPEVSFLRLNFDRLNTGALPRKEVLLSAEVTMKGKTIAKTSLPIMRPYAWEVYGPGRFLPLDGKGPLDGEKRLEEGMKGEWVPFKDGAWSHFGVLDFGLHFTGNSKHAPGNKTVYARAKVNVPETGEYLFKVQSDDQMLFWVDGETIIRHGGISPVTRTAIRKKVRLEKGEHLLKMRVNQVRGPWQAAVRIRTPDDGISGVVGLPLMEKEAGK